MTENEAIKIINDKYETFFALSTTNDFDIAMATAIQALEEIQQYRAIGTIEEFKALKEKNEKRLEVVKLLTIASICYQKNLNIIMEEMRENKELVTLYCKLPTVQYTKNTLALSKLADSDIDVNNIESLDEIIGIFDWQ